MKTIQTCSRPLENILSELRREKLITKSIPEYLALRIQRGRELLTKRNRKIGQYVRKYAHLQGGVDHCKNTDFCKFAYFDEIYEDNILSRRLITRDAIAYSPEGKIKIVYDSEDLQRITSRSKFEHFLRFPHWGNESDLPRNKYLQLTEEKYKALAGPEFLKNDLQEYFWLCSRIIGRSTEYIKVIENPLWLAGVRGDKELLQQYARLAFSIPSGWQKDNPPSRMNVILGPIDNFALGLLVLGGIANDNADLYGDLGIYKTGFKEMVVAIPHAKK